MTDATNILEEAILQGQAYRHDARTQEQYRREVYALLAGRDGEAHPALAWIRSLGEEELVELERRALTRADRNRGRLDRTIETRQGSWDVHVWSWQRVMEWREELEGVRVLLRGIGKGEELDRTLADQDAKAAAAVIPGNARVSGVKALDPLAWWG